MFIVGVPLNGTTLTATRLARATGARDRGELRALRFIAERLRSGGHLSVPELMRFGEMARHHAIETCARQKKGARLGPRPSFRITHRTTALSTGSDRPCTGLPPARRGSRPGPSKAW